MYVNVDYVSADARALVRDEYNIFCANGIFPIHISRFTFMCVLSLQRFAQNSTAPVQISSSCIQSSTCIIIHACSLKRVHEGGSTAKLVMFLDCTVYLQTIGGLQERQIVPPYWRSIRGTLPVPLCEAVCMPAHQCPAKEVRSHARGAVLRVKVTPTFCRCPLGAPLFETPSFEAFPSDRAEARRGRPAFHLCSSCRICVAIAYVCSSAAKHKQMFARLGC